MKEINIGIMGTPVSSGNRGVLALASSLIGLVRSNHPESNIHIFVGNREPGSFTSYSNGDHIVSKIVNYRLSPKSKINQHLFCILAVSLLYRIIGLQFFRAWLRKKSPWIQAVSSCSIIGDIRGGDSFSDIYGLPRFLTSFIPSWSIILVRGSMIHFPQTYGPFKSPIARWLASYLLKRSTKVVARDTISQRIAQELIGDKGKVLLCPDVAFSLSPKAVSSISLDPPPETTSQSEIVGINVNGLMYNGGYTRNNMFGLELDYKEYIQQLIIELCKIHTGEIWLVPHTFAPLGDVESDNETNILARNALPQECAKRVRIVDKDYDQNEIKAVISECSFFIGSRMHSCIAALSQGIPCIGLAYSMKFEGVFNSVGVQDWVIDARNHTTKDAVARTLELFKKKDFIKSSLKTNIENAKATLSSAFTEILET